MSFYEQIRGGEQLPPQQESSKSTNKYDKANLLLLQGLLVIKILHGRAWAV